MKKLSRLSKIVSLPAIMITSLTSIQGAGIWDGGGVGASWSTEDNWDDDLVPAAGANVEFGTAFTSGTAITLGANREVGTLTFNHASTSMSLSGNTLQINDGIIRSAGVNSDIFSAVSLPGNITVNTSAGGRIRFGGVISGTGNIDFTNTTAAAGLQLDGNNTGWSGGLTLQAGVANSVVNLFNTNALGTGDVVWKTGATGPSVVINGSYSIANDFILEGTADRTINPFNVSGGVDGTTALDGNITGSGNSTIRFQPRSTNITGHITELNGVNSNADAGSRMVFFGSTNDTTSAVGNTYLIGNDQALDWGRVVLGQSATNEEIVFLYKDGITISRSIELNETDPSATTMGVYGTNATAEQADTIQLSSFGGAGTKNLSLFADTDSTFTVSGNVAVSNATDTLNIIKTGAGTVALTNAAGTGINGSTTVSAGTLLVNNSTGSGLGTSDVVVDAGTLGGSGTFTGSITVNADGTLAPGNSIESLASGALAFNDGSTFAYEVDSAALSAVGADLQVVSGNLSLSGVVTLTLENLSVGVIANNTTFTLINYEGTWNGGLFTFESVELSNLETFTFNGQEWQIEYDSATLGLNFTTDYLPGSSFVNVTAIPEPSAVALLTAGLVAVVLFRRRLSPSKVRIS